MANAENVIGHTFTDEERKVNGRKGGKARVKKIQERKAWKEKMNILLGMSIDTAERKKDIQMIEKAKSFNDLIGKNVVVEDGILATLVQLALNGNKDSLKAIEMIMGIIGQTPVPVKPKEEETQTEIEDMNALQQLFTISQEDIKADEERQKEIEKEMAQYATNE